MSGRVVRDWESIVARVQEHPNLWVLLPELTGVPPRVSKVVRLRQVQALTGLKGGKLHASWVSERSDKEDISLLFPEFVLLQRPMESRNGDIYLKWVPEVV